VAGVTSPEHSVTRILANKRRKVALSPDYDNQSHKLSVSLRLGQENVRLGMRGYRLVLLRIAITALAGILWQSIAWPQETLGERESVLAALTLAYGQPVEKGKPVFAITTEYVLSPVFSADALLIEIAIEPKSNNHEQDPQRPWQLSRSEFDSILANINSIKPLGALKEDFPAKFVHGGRAWGNMRYHDAYLETAEPISHVSPRPIAFAYIYYLHPVTGMATIPSGSRLDEVGSFGLVCVKGESYIAPKAEFMKLRSNPFERQTVKLAGPTRDGCGKLP